MSKAISVTTKYNYQATNVALSNGDVSDDIGWPLTSQTTSIFAFFVAFHNFVVSKHRDFIFGVQVDRS